MTHNDTRISNERLAEVDQRLEMLIELAAKDPWDYADQIKARGLLMSHLTTLQALRSTPVEAEPAVWRWTYSIEEGGRMMGPFYGERAPDLSDWPNAVVTHLYAHPLPNPSPSDGEVSEAEVENALRVYYGDGSPAFDDHQRDDMRRTLQSSKQGQQ